MKEINWVIAAGAGGLGFVIGALVAIYVDEVGKVTFRVLQGSIAVLAGSGVAAIIHILSGHQGPTDEYWFYGVGLVPGLLFGLIYNWLKFEPYRS